MLEVLVVPNPLLRQVTKPVHTVNKKLLDLISEMIKTLAAARDPEGVGLAAPQVGVPLRLFIVRPTPKDAPQVFINPEIIKFSQRQQKGDSKKGVYEGCLSIPHHYSPLTRSMSVTVKYQTIEPSSKFKALNPKQFSDLNIKNLNIILSLELQDLSLTEKVETFSGLTAHIIQHETDHLNGILFVDRVLEQNSKLFNIHGKKWEELSL